MGLWNLRSFLPREIRKFIKCVPAEVLKRGRSVSPSSLFMTPLRMMGKETGNARAGVLTRSAFRHGQPADTLGGRVPQPLWMCIQGPAKPSTLCSALLMLPSGHSLKCGGGGQAGTISSPWNPACSPRWHRGSQNDVDSSRHSWEAADCLAGKTRAQSVLNEEALFTFPQLPLQG